MAPLAAAQVARIKAVDSTVRVEHAWDLFGPELVAERARGGQHAANCRVAIAALLTLSKDFLKATQQKRHGRLDNAPFRADKSPG